MNNAGRAFAGRCANSRIPDYDLRDTPNRHRWRNSAESVSFDITSAAWAGWEFRRGRKESPQTESPLNLDARARQKCRSRRRLIIFGANRCHRFKGFVYEHAHFSADKKRIEVAVRARKSSAAVCSRCHLPARGYDQLAERRFEFIPLSGSCWQFLRML